MSRVHENGSFSEIAAYDLILTSVENTCLKVFQRFLSHDPAVNRFDEVRLPATFTSREKR